MAKRGLAVLQRVPLFEGLSSRQLRHVADLSEEARFMEGATIVKEGDPGDSFYVILEGQAKVLRGGRTINRLIPGDFFGEISLLDGGERSASVVSETPMVLMELKQRKFFKMLNQEPGLSLKMMERLAQRLRELERPLAG